MKKDNVIQQKSFTFAVRIVNLYRYLNKEKGEYNLSKQLLRAGTSIGANVEEVMGGQSLLDDTEELLRIIGSIQKTIKSRNS